MIYERYMIFVEYIIFVFTLLVIRPLCIKNSDWWGYSWTTGLLGSPCFPPYYPTVTFVDPDQKEDFKVLCNEPARSIVRYFEQQKVPITIYPHTIHYYTILSHCLHL